jgi:arylsulfatase A-like enzyme
MSSRRQFLKQVAAATAVGALGSRRARGNGAPVNVVFVSIDDLNDFPAPFGGYAGIHTPSMNKLAAESVVFQKAFCAGPYCGASRSSTLTGAAPYRTGIIDNVNIMDPALLPGAISSLGQTDLFTVPRYFKALNYKTYGGGKIYHGGFGQGAANTAYDEAAWDEYFQTDFTEIASTFPGVRDYRDNRTIDQIMMGDAPPGDMPSMIAADYNTIDREVVMPDRKLAAWAVNKLINHELDGSPFFMALGIFRPHIAMFVPQRFYDLYPLGSVYVPSYREQLNDQTDLPEFALRNLVNMDWTAYGATMPSGDPSSDQYLLQQMVTKDGRAGDAQCVQAYLASVSFADECLGHVLSALDQSGLRDNTIVVLWADHGWFLGEKLTWQKYKIWERVCRVPVMISVPGGARGNCNSVVSLLDLFPTLIDLTGGSVPSFAAHQLDGVSLRPLLEKPQCDIDTYAITTQSLAEVGTAPPPGTPATMFHSLRTSRWRYIAYPPIPGATLSEELYDLDADPGEKRNLLYWEPDRYEQVRQALANLLASRVH